MRESQSNEKDVVFKPKEKKWEEGLCCMTLPHSALCLFMQKVPKFRRLSCCKHKDLQHTCIFCFFFLLKYKLFCVGNFNLFAQGIVPEYRCNFETVLPILPLKLSCRFFSFRYFNLSFLLFFNWTLN